MFSYIDERIRKVLEEKGRIRTVAGAGGLRLAMIGPIPLPVMDPSSGQEKMLDWYPFVRRTELEEVDGIARGLRDGRPDGLLRLVSSFMCVNSVLVHGDLGQHPRPLVRVHSCCMTSDVFGSMRCDCGPQLRESWRRIFGEGAGALVYMSGHEGRGIGLWAKGVTYLLQDMGQDTYQANESLGLPADSRDFTDAAVALRHLLRPGAAIRLLTNNPMKVDHMRSGGIDVVEQVELVAGVTRHNLRYLHAKRGRGHGFGSLPAPEDQGKG